MRDDLLGSKRDACGMFGRQRERFVQRVGVQRLRPAQHGRQRLKRHAHDIVVRLLRRQRAAGRLRMEAKDRRARIPAVEALGHHLVPDFPGGAVLGDLFEEIVVRVEEEREPRRKLVDVQARAPGPLDVLDAVVQRERQLLQRRRARFANVISADRNRVPLRHVLRAELERVDDELHRGPRRENVRLLRDVFLENVVLDRSAKLLPRHALLFGDGQVHRPQDRGRRVGRHRSADLVERNALEQRFHVGQRIDGDAALADFAFRHRMVGVVTHQRRQMESDGKSRLAVLQQVVISAIGLLGRAEAAELPHRPELAAVHRFVNAARVGWLAGIAEIAVVIEVVDVFFACRHA